MARCWVKITAGVVDWNIFDVLSTREAGWIDCEIRARSRRQVFQRFSISLNKVKEISLFAPKKMYLQRNLTKQNHQKRGERRWGYSFHGKFLTLKCLQPGNDRVEECSVKVRILGRIGTDVFQALDDVVWRRWFHGKMSSLWLKSALICNIGQSDFVSFRSSVRKFASGCCSIRTAFRCLNSIARFESKTVRAVRVQKLVLSYDGSGTFRPHSTGGDSISSLLWRRKRARNDHQNKSL